MSNEKWLEGWSAVRERGLARYVLIGAACGFAGGILTWLPNELYRWATGAYLSSNLLSTSPYDAFFMAASAAIAFRIVWSVCERKYRRLTKATAAPRGLESPTN